MTPVINLRAIFRSRFTLGDRLASWVSPPPSISRVALLLQFVVGLVVAALLVLVGATLADRLGVRSRELMWLVGGGLEFLFVMCLALWRTWAAAWLGNVTGLSFVLIDPAWLTPNADDPNLAAFGLTVLAMLLFGYWVTVAQPPRECKPGDSALYLLWKAYWYCGEHGRLRIRTAMRRIRSDVDIREHAEDDPRSVATAALWRATVCLLWVGLGVLWQLLIRLSVVAPIANAVLAGLRIRRERASTRPPRSSSTSDLSHSSD